MSCQNNLNLSGNVPAIEAKHVSMRYDLDLVVTDISFALPKGSLTALIGPNGAGKSTLFKGLLGLHPLVQGEVLFNGQRISEVRRQIAYLPQKSEVNWEFPLTVGDLALMGRYPHLGWLRRPGKKDRKMAKEALAMVEMESFAKRQISELSGGQKQRAFLARALAQKADFYFLDEAFQGIDIRSSEILWKILAELKASDKTIVMVHHDLTAIDERFDHAVLIKKELIAAGSPDEVLSDANLDVAYRGFRR
ncbi:MAG: metal ABC transporter ATP-binding protein [Eubacteriales bacterium]|nr:metal ABC transporter ATP-binding protein [Eubacteriales bacterium]